MVGDLLTCLPSESLPNDCAKRAVDLVVLRPTVVSGKALAAGSGAVTRG